MALTDYEIQESDYTGNDVSGLSDRPSLTASQLKARFDSLVKNVVVAKFNGLIAALITTVSGLISKVSGGTEDNFASLTSGGEVQDSGYNAADFAAASHATDTDNPHAVTCAQLGALNKRVSYYWTSAYDLDVLLDSTMLVGSAVQNTSGLFDVIGGEFAYITQLFYGGTTATNNRVQYAFGYTHNKMAMRRYHDLQGGWQAWKEILVNNLGNITADGAIGSTSDLPVFTGTDGVLETKTAVDTRTALGLGDSATKDVGTASDEVAAGNHSHTRASLGILTYCGSVTVPSSSNSVSVTMYGLTSSYHAVAMRVGSVVPSTGVIVNSTVCTTNTCTVYFDSYGAPSTIGLYIIATL